MKEVPRLFPPQLTSDVFLDRFAADAPLVLEHEAAINSHLNHQSDYVALCHWNVNVDNAWFFTDPAGELQAGLLDWGSVGQMHVAHAFYGLICAAETTFLAEHRSDLLALYVAEFERHGGPPISIDTLSHSLKLSIAVLGIAWMLNAPALIEAEVPNVHRVRDRYDPKIKDVFLARAQLQVLVVFLNEWLTEDIGSAVRRLIAS